MDKLHNGHTKTGLPSVMHMVFAVSVSLLFLASLSSCTIATIRDDIETTEASIVVKEGELVEENKIYSQLQSQIQQTQSILDDKEADLTEVAFQIEMMKKQFANALAQTEAEKERKLKIDTELSALLDELKEVKSIEQQQSLSIQEKQKRLSYLRKKTIKSLKIIEAI